MRIFYKMKNIIKKSIELLNYLSIVKMKKSKLNGNNCRQIILVSHDMEKAGAQILLLNIAKELKLRNYKLIILTKKGGPLIKQFREISVTFVLLSHNITSILLKYLKQKGFTYVICNSVASGDLISLFSNLGYHTMSLVHELPMIIKEYGLFNNAQIISKKANIVIFPSSFVKSEFSRMINVDYRYEIKPQGLYMNIGHIPNKQFAKHLILNRYNLRENKKIVLNVATGILRKGFDWFLEIAINMLNEENIIFIWVGNYIEDILNNILKKYNLNTIPNLILPGYISNQNELANYYDAADLLLLTSREEPFGSIVLEAFNSCTPVIGFKDGGGYVDVVIPEKTGVLVNYGNLTEMQEAVLMLINNKERLEILGKNSKKLIDKYNFKSYIDFLLSNLFMEGNK